MLGLDGALADSPEDTPLVESEVTAVTLSAEQTAIQKAILGQNRDPETPIDILSCCSFVTLETLSATPLAGSVTKRITYYGWALYEEFMVTDNRLEEVGGSHIPVVLTFEFDDYGSSLLEYWTPQDDSYYIQEHSSEFRELMYYGRYTLQYCFARFEEGNKTGLNGHVMAQVCQEIAAGWGEALLYDYELYTGQEWYSAFKTNALTLKEQYSERELAEYYSASYLLLSMLGEI